MQRAALAALRVTSMKTQGSAELDRFAERILDASTMRCRNAPGREPRPLAKRWWVAISGGESWS